ncbi:hypothetical protein [Flavimaricola marinus]|uniref:Sugar transporter n=1 Tax=Flavimaricola marinus TaxID=1819565 RepID=A0A238LIU3_9RHOB|nr:hypothetical protein [Flavimaricola marinus]SMY08790.1 hypothetical protein LOM8899_02946 [Flavimaricola marinus]
MRTPWHLWVVGGVSLLWNAGGAYDYLMTQLNNEAYLSMLTEPQRALMDSRPVWFDAAWAIGVWGSILGSLLLLLRSRFAVQAFLASFLGLIVSAIWSFGIAEPSSFEVMGSFAAIFSLAIAVVIVLLYLYARAMAARGVLR